MTPTLQNRLRLRVDSDSDLLQLLKTLARPGFKALYPREPRQNRELQGRKSDQNGMLNPTATALCHWDKNILPDGAKLYQARTQDFLWEGHGPKDRDGPQGNPSKKHENFSDLVHFF